MVCVRKRHKNISCLAQLIEQHYPDSDIGFFVAEAFDHPDEWVGATEEIAGDLLTIAELRSALATAFGHEIEHVQPTW